MIDAITASQQITDRVLINQRLAIDDAVYWAAWRAIQLFEQRVYFTINIWGKQDECCKLSDNF